ncbi:MAG: hypothetical protein ACAI25_20205 [Planctomycetota bacterium]
MSDSEIRDLERRARDGDARAIATLRRRRAALDQDFEGTALDARREPRRFGRYTVTLVPVEPGRYVACVEEVRDVLPRTLDLIDRYDLQAGLDAGVRWVVVDLSSRVLTSALVSTLISLRRIFIRHGGDVLLVTDESQRVVLELLGVAGEFPPYDDRIATLRAILTRP